MVTKKKPKSKEKRCKELAEKLYVGAIANLAEIIPRLPAAPSRQDVEKMIQKRFDLCVEAAKVFDESWPRVRGLFKEGKDGDDEEDED